MRHRFAFFAVLAALVLAVAGCGGDPPDPGAAGPATTAQTAPKATMPPATSEARPKTTRAAPNGVVPAGQREPAPDLHVTDFDGRTITLGGFRGQPVVVNFFESW
jgi:cytochrome oxidase Cu insertion factor (SCO1/SenC/PrrC family)